MCGATGVGRERVLGAGSGREEASRRSKGRRSIFLCEGYIRGRRRCGCQFSSRPSERSSQKWCDPWPVHDNCLALSSAEGTLAKAPCLVAIVLVRPFFFSFSLHYTAGEEGSCTWVLPPAVGIGVGEALTSAASFGIADPGQRGETSRYNLTTSEVCAALGGGRMMTASMGPDATCNSAL